MVGKVCKFSGIVHTSPRGLEEEDVCPSEVRGMAKIQDFGVEDEM